jgi:hypothetical protein
MGTEFHSFLNLALNGGEDQIRYRIQRANRTLHILEDMGEQHEHLTFLKGERNDCYVTVILLV